MDYTRAIADVESTPASMMAVKAPALREATYGYNQELGKQRAIAIDTNTALQESAFGNRMARRGLNRGMREGRLGTLISLGGIGVEAYNQKKRMMKEIERQNEAKEYMSKIDLLHNIFQESGQSMRQMYTDYMNELKKQSDAMYGTPEGGYGTL